MEITWLYSFLDRPTSKLLFDSTSDIAVYKLHAHKHMLTLESVAVESEILWCSGTLQPRQAAKGEKTLNAWKNRKLPQFQWSRKKNSREKCQQQIAAGFYCHRRRGLWFSHVSFLPHYASSFHPIKHKYRQQNNSGSISLLFTLGEIKSRAKQRKTCQWNNEKQKG